MKKNPDVHKGHRIRLRRRFLLDGIDNFEPHNVLELVLFYAMARGDTNEVAHNLISRYGSLPAVFEAPYDDLVKTEGIGDISATLIKLIPEVAGYYMAQKALGGVKMNSVTEVSKYFSAKFLASSVEEFHLMSLNGAGKMIRCTKICEGTVDAVPVVTRMVLTEAINSNASSVIAAHNHPSGILIPSSNDSFLTQNIYKALYHAGIRLDDHLIISGNEYVSFRETGFFEKYPDYSPNAL